LNISATILAAGSSERMEEAIVNTFKDQKLL
jgi:CTP:molybdopterin cytidylyltransferase MocA